MKYQTTFAMRIVAVRVADCHRGLRPRVSKDFASIDDALGALVAAARSDDTRALVRVLGSEAEPALESGDPVQDRNARERFVRAYEAEHTLSRDSTGATTLLVGTDQWPFPSRWSRAMAAGVSTATPARTRIVNRRVGYNELATIQSTLAFVDAEREYYARNPQQNSLLQFAQRLVSAKGQKDGLYWPTADSRPSPLGEAFARAQAKAISRMASKNEPLRGYIYRLLTAQGPHAEGGAFDYLVDDKMIGGFALIAVPAEYGRSGVMSFIVNHDGVVFSKDLGPDTQTVARDIQAFDPDPTWQREPAVELIP